MLRLQNNRREKSLGLLCQKFLSFYPMYLKQGEQIVISLDHMAKLLEVERRRIYDIVNVLESVEIMSRYCKNQYIWHGFAQIPYTLSKLKTLAVKSNFLDYAKSLMASQLENSIDLHSDAKQATNVCYEPQTPKKTILFQNTMTNTAQTRDVETQTISISREEKSLGIMSQKFLMLFLTSEDGIVSINFAARVLLGDSKNDITELGRFKTKIRRLYDIANILSSINLINKYHYSDLSISKPAYKYIGPEVDIIRDADYVFNFMNAGNPMSNSKHSLFDHFKRNLDLECNIPKFDVNTGILTTKGNQIKSSRSQASIDEEFLIKANHDAEFAQSQQIFAAHFNRSNTHHHHHSQFNDYQQSMPNAASTGSCATLNNINYNNDPAYSMVYTYPPVAAAAVNAQSHQSCDNYYFNTNFLTSTHQHNQFFINYYSSLPNEPANNFALPSINTFLE